MSNRPTSVAGPLIAAVVLVASIGCGPKTEGQFVNDFAGAYCTMYSMCNPMAFASAYPAGQSDCVGTFTRGLTGSQLNGPVACSSAQQEQCMSDIAAIMCGTSLQPIPAVPLSCSCP
jgi:hypothetical protein